MDAMDDFSPSTIILDRLSEFIGPDCDPWGVGNVMHLIGTIKGVLDEPRNENWSKKKHIQRIQYLLTSYQLDDPISIDCLCSQYEILPIPTILDGWHRLYAHWYLGRRTIKANFGGLIDLLEYLTGERGDCPES